VSNKKNAKLGQKGLCGGHETHFWIFWNPPNISGMNEPRNFKFGTDMDGSEYSLHERCIKTVTEFSLVLTHSVRC